PKVGGPPFSGAFVASSRHAHRNRVAIAGNGFKLPDLGADKSVRRRIEIVRFGAKPGEADWYAPSDRVSLFPPRVFAKKNYFLSAPGFPRGDVRAMQVHLRRCCGRGDAHFVQSAVVGHDPRNPCYGEAAIEFFECGYCSHVRPRLLAPAWRALLLPLPGTHESELFARRQDLLEVVLDHVEQMGARLESGNAVG